MEPSAVAAVSPKSCAILSSFGFPGRDSCAAAISCAVHPCAFEF